MANSLSNKLTRLENNVVSEDVDESTTHLDYSELPEAEQELHRFVQSFMHNNPAYSDLSPNQLELLEQSAMLISKRVFLLFARTLQAFCMINENSGYEVEFNVRLGWFMRECTRLGKQAMEMELLKIENAGLDEDALDEKQIELESKQPELFTKESFEKYETEAFKKAFERHGAKTSLNTAEQGSNQNV